MASVSIKINLNIFHNIIMLSAKYQAENDRQMDALHKQVKIQMRNYKAKV